MNVCLAPSRVLCNLSLSGHLWVYLNWTLGLQANGCCVTWLERFDPGTPANTAVMLLRTLREQFAALAVNIPITIYFWPGQREEFAAIADELADLTVDLDDVADASDLLLNFYYALEPSILRRFRRTALVDIDPGLLQWWITLRQLNVSAHDVYVTTGETVGRRDSKIPDCGLEWRYFPPVVHLPAWPVRRPGEAGSYGTISSWWAEWETIDGELFSNEKRSSFQAFLDLPNLASTTLELGICLDESDPEIAMLRAKGWQVFDPRRRCGTPVLYRQHIQQARGEFSCVKPSCMRLANAWISDRTLCYLATGKPVVVQHTGPSRLLPDGEGMFRFRDLAEAAAAIAAIEADYERHAQAARHLAEEHFGAVKVVRQLLAEIG